MIRSFIEGILGPLGRQILYFYEANALPINLVVLIYGTTMLMSWTTLLRIYRHAVILVARGIHEHPELDRKSSAKRVEETLEIPWEEAVKAAPFPLVARQGGLIPKLKSVETVRGLIDEHEIMPHALEVLKGTPLRRIKPSYQLMRRKEVIKQDAQDSSRGQT